jgi:beta-glucoside operon transcriptional antiterminator
MIVVKNINNNVSLCLDSHNREVVVFGKGVGFVKPPADLPLGKIERTFYNLNRHYLDMLSDIPADVLSFTAKYMSIVQDHLPYETNANLIATLADHLAFTMKRVENGIHIPMPSLYEMEASFPLEIKVGRYFVSAFEREFKTTLPRGEVQGVAMHFINARAGGTVPQTPDIEDQYETILERTTQIIEHAMGIQVKRDAFNYARFASHVQYLLKRILQDMHIDSENLKMYHSIRSEYPDVAACVDQISEYYKNNLSADLNEEEKLYLIMHINRVCSQEAS